MSLQSSLPWVLVGAALFATSAAASPASTPVPLQHAVPDPTALPEPPVDPPTESVEERDVARALNRPGKFLPLVLGLPLSVASVSVTDSAPIAWGFGDTTGYTILRGVGLPMMAGALTANVLINAMARASRQLAGGRWQDEVGLFAAGTSLMAAGLATTVVSGHTAVLEVPGASGALAVGGAVAWAGGSILLIVDSMKIALATEPKLAAGRPTPEVMPTFLWAGGPQLAIVGRF